MTLRLAICLCGLLFMAPSVFSQAPELPPLPKGAINVGDAAKIKAVLAREEEMRVAYMKLDPKLAADLYSEDFLVLKMNSCCVANRDAQMLEIVKHRDTKPAFPITAISKEQMVVRIHGDTAVVTGVDVITVTFVEEEPRRTDTVSIAFMNVWAREKGKWMLIGSSHRTV